MNSKREQLLEMYRTIATDGVAIGHGEMKKTIPNAYNNMEIRRFWHLVKPSIARLGCRNLLDYGCGGSDYDRVGFHEEQSAKAYLDLDEVFLYEPARDIDERQKADCVVCFDVLEHIWINDLPNVIREIFSYAKKLVVINVACYPARAHLPNGENAHITVRPPEWWKGYIDAIAAREYPNIAFHLFASKTYNEVRNFGVMTMRDFEEIEGFVANPKKIVK